MIGKVDPAVLERIVERTGAESDALLWGPAYGEDAAAIDLGGQTLVISSDPISLAADRIGTLGIHVACNDVAASGADPEWLTSVLLLPSDDEEPLESIVTDLDREADRLGATIVGGHTEISDQLSRPLLSMTALGIADRFVASSGAAPGDRVVLTKGAGIEATAILATDFRSELDDVPDDVVDRAATFFEDISVVPDARVLRGVATAMHDPTEGGVLDGLLELARASGVLIDVDRDAVPVREETERLCAALDVDPLRAFGSGALLATVPAADVEDALDDLADAGIDAATIGAVEGSDEPAVAVDGERYAEPRRDDLYALWE